MPACVPLIKKVLPGETEPTKETKKKIVRTNKARGFKTWDPLRRHFVSHLLKKQNQTVSNWPLSIHRRHP